MTERTHNPYTATKWYDRQGRWFYVGMERNGSLIMLDGVPGFSQYAGLSGVDSGNKSQRDADFKAMQEAARLMNADFNGVQS